MRTSVTVANSMERLSEIKVGDTSTARYYDNIVSHQWASFSGSDEPVTTQARAAGQDHRTELSEDVAFISDRKP